MKELICKSFWMLSFIETQSHQYNKMCFHVYNHNFRFLHGTNEISESDIINKLLEITSTNFNINTVFRNNFVFYCAPIRSCDGALTGYIVLKTNDKDSNDFHKIGLQAIANQTSLLIENETIKKTLSFQNLIKKTSDSNRLTEKEMLVYKYLSLGKSDVEIASDLKISKSTLRMHLKNIFEKLSVSSRAEAIARYYIQCISIIDNQH